MLQLPFLRHPRTAINLTVVIQHVIIKHFKYMYTYNPLSMSSTDVCKYLLQFFTYLKISNTNTITNLFALVLYKIVNL